MLLLTCTAEAPHSGVGCWPPSQGWPCSSTPGPGQSEVGSQGAAWWLGLLRAEWPALVGKGVSRDMKESMKEA